MNGAETFDDKSICNANGLYKQEQAEERIVGMGYQLEDSRLIQVFPNPARSHVSAQFELHEGEKAEWILYDLIGNQKLKLNLDYENDKVSTSIESLPKGVYIYKCIINGNNIAGGKLIIE